MVINPIVNDLNSEILLDVLYHRNSKPGQKLAGDLQIDFFAGGNASIKDLCRFN